LSNANSLKLEWRPLRYGLTQPLENAHGRLGERSGWLLKLTNTNGESGWGEAIPLACQYERCRAAIQQLEQKLELAELEQQLTKLPAAVSFGLGLALTELKGLVGNWLKAPVSAWLLPAGADAIPTLKKILEISTTKITVKWKVASQTEADEREILEKLLQLLPANADLRLDANGGWDLPCAERWVERLRHEPRLEWLEQPVAAKDHNGLLQLAELLPVALDESLRDPVGIPTGWCGWRVHKPTLEGDPRPLLEKLKNGTEKLMISTAFGTGISNRFLEHLAALQILGPTPCAPGLAPGWGPEGELASTDPEKVWAAAGDMKSTPGFLEFKGV
jgi:O-succinylbenzoate synthase